MKGKALLELKVERSINDDKKIREFIDSLVEGDPVIREQHFDEHVEYLVFSKEDYMGHPQSGEEFDLGVLKDLAIW